MVPKPVLQRFPMNFQQVVEYFGKKPRGKPSVTRAAKKLGITPQGMRRWEKGGIPHWWQELIQLRTRGKLTAAPQ